MSLPPPPPPPPGLSFQFGALAGKEVGSFVGKGLSKWLEKGKAKTTQAAAAAAAAKADPTTWIPEDDDLEYVKDPLYIQCSEIFTTEK
jgi:hypothetical protein